MQTQRKVFRSILLSGILKSLSIVTISLLIAVSSQADDKEKTPAEELMEIIEMENALKGRLQEDIREDYLISEFELRARRIRTAYEDYTEKYPDDLYGNILFGKFLRMVDDMDEAHEYFLKAYAIDPDVAVVRQQMANYLAESGKIQEALDHLRAAIRLEPDVAQYHYQLGELLHIYRAVYLGRELLTQEELEALMHRSFAEAHYLAPDVRDYQARYAESFFDITEPNWTVALTLWNNLLETTQNLFERDVFRLQKARVLTALEDYANAREVIESVTDTSLLRTRREMLDNLPSGNDG